MLNKSGNGPPTQEFNWCKNIWNIKTAPKIKNFLWKLKRKAIPVSSNMATRGIPTFNCKTCNDVDDDLHTFLLGPVAASVWNLAPLQNIPSPYLPLIAALLVEASTYTVLPPVGLSIPLWPWILWNI